MCSSRFTVFAYPPAGGRQRLLWDIGTPWNTKQNEWKIGSGIANNKINIECRTIKWEWMGYIGIQYCSMWIHVILIIHTIGQAIANPLTSKHPRFLSRTPTHPQSSGTKFGRSTAVSVCSRSCRCSTCPEASLSNISSTPVSLKTPISWDIGSPAWRWQNSPNSSEFND